MSGFDSFLNACASDCVNGDAPTAANDTTEGDTMPIVVAPPTNDLSRSLGESLDRLTGTATRVSVDAPIGPPKTQARLQAQHTAAEVNALEWEQQDIDCEVTEWRPGSDNESLSVMTGSNVPSLKGKCWVLFEPFVPDMETGKELAELLAATARKFATERGF